ncbi:MAG: VWA domain-containing protein [Phycisphaerae bacterium]|jgi:Ca-activated chloride channel family protein|nr:VWA domain-containing protein [Phycisphaerae bacterium]
MVSLQLLPSATVGFPCDAATAWSSWLPVCAASPAGTWAAETLRNPGVLLMLALAIMALVAVAEWFHAKRIARVARLAFGSTGKPALWTAVVPGARIVAAGLLAWGLGFLATYDPIEIDTRPAKNASQHVLLCFDASPSMHIADAGPDKEKVSRAVWGGKVVQAILDRLDMDITRVTIVAFYTDALPIVKETFDKEVVRNVLDGLPMYAAFEPGGTDVNKGVLEALEQARPWPKKSALLVVVTDGDTAGSAPPNRLPSSIADSIVVGVGDSNRTTPLWGRPSRQDSASLRQLAARLGGLYHDGNVKHLPSSVLERLSMIQPRVGADVALRDLALFAVGLGGFTLALATPALLVLGQPRAYARSRSRPVPMPSPAFRSKVQGKGAGQHARPDRSATSASHSSLPESLA